MHAQRPLRCHEDSLSQRRLPAAGRLRRAGPERFGPWLRPSGGAHLRLRTCPSESDAGRFELKQGGDCIDVSSKQNQYDGFPEQDLCDVHKHGQNDVRARDQNGSAPADHYKQDQNERALLGACKEANMVGDLLGAAEGPPRSPASAGARPDAAQEPRKVGDLFGAAGEPPRSPSARALVGSCPGDIKGR